TLQWRWPTPLQCIYGISNAISNTIITTSDAFRNEDSSAPVSSDSKPRRSFRNRSPTQQGRSSARHPRTASSTTAYPPCVLTTYLTVVDIHKSLLIEQISPHKDIDGITTASMG